MNDDQTQPMGADKIYHSFYSIYRDLLFKNSITQESIV